MKKILIAIALLFSTPSFAIKQAFSTMKYSIVPSLGYSFGFSEMGVSGSMALNHGPFGGLGLKFEQNGYFFTPGAKIQPLIGVQNSAALLWSFGFIAGGRVQASSLDVFAGVDFATINSLNSATAAILRAGAIFDLGQSGYQLNANVFYGGFNQTTATQIITYPYFGLETSVQIPIDL